MEKKYQELINTKLRHLVEEFSFIENEISIKLQRLKSISKEMAELNLALHNATSPRKSDNLNIVNGVQTTRNPTGFYIKNGAKIRHGSIKDFVVQVLSDSKNGLPALDILAAINDRFNKNYTRTSLSPQLSRLKEDGVLGLRGPIWYLLMGDTKS